MKNVILTFIFIVSYITINAQNSDVELITQTLQNYIEGSTNGKPQLLKKAFHPDLKLYYVKNNELKTWSGTSYILDTKKGKSTGESGKILSIDFENNAAVAKVEIAHPKNKAPYIDYFMLLKIKEKWIIVHKMFTKKVVSSTSFKNPKLKFLWETDSLLTDIESAIYDDKNNIIYTTNINGHWLKKNGKGFISKVNLEGKITNLKWVNNIEGPTGTAIYNNKLYVADFDKVLKINISTGKVEKSCLIKGTERINDLTVADNGIIYGTATKTGKLFAIHKGKTTILNDSLSWPNGVLFDNGKLLIGQGDKTISLFDINSKTLKPLAVGIPSPDGIVAIGNGDYLISSWEGMIHYVTKDGKKTLLLDTSKEKINAADITYIPSKKMILVPAMLQNKLVAYKLIDLKE